MFKIVKVILLCIYIALITQYINSLLMSQTHEEVIQVELDQTKIENEKIMKERKTKLRDINITIATNMPERLPTDFKYILQFTQAFAHKSSYITKGQDEFIDANCKHINCYITNDRRLLPGVQYFDAILFDVENTWQRYPAVRSPHQKYVFVSLEAAQDYPICDKRFDDFFNLTWTYKLDSDITWPYITIYDKNGAVVGPKINMTWQYPMDTIPGEVKKKLEKKTKVAAWFVSNCVTESKRGVLYERLQVEFLKFNVSIDVFGACAKKQCPKDRMAECLALVQSDYYFYLAFESAMSQDFVTEKVLNALLHYAVPVVYGGANYTRFLPPGSYINADDETPENVVALVIDAMQNRNTYEDYFRWHNHYVYKPSHTIGDVCTLCEILNRPLKHSTVTRFRKWWNPAYASMTDDCQRFY